MEAEVGELAPAGEAPELAQSLWQDGEWGGQDWGMGSWGSASPPTHLCLCPQAWPGPCCGSRPACTELPPTASRPVSQGLCVGGGSGVLLSWPPPRAGGATLTRSPWPGLAQPVPLVPLSEENEDAMEEPRFQRLLCALGLRPPASEQVGPCLCVVIVIVFPPPQGGSMGRAPLPRPGTDCPIPSSGVFLAHPSSAESPAAAPGSRLHCPGGHQGAGGRRGGGGGCGGHGAASPSHGCPAAGPEQAAGTR